MFGSISCILIIKIIISLIFITSGTICLSENSCSVSLSYGLIGFGIGIIISSFLSLILYYTLSTIEEKTSKNVMKIRVFIGIKFLIALILLIAASICFSNQKLCVNNSISDLLFGSFGGLVLSAIFSGSLYFFIIIKHCIVK